MSCSSQRVQVKELQLICLAKSLWLLSCSSQRVQVKELQLVCLAKSEVVELLITESAGEGTSSGVFG